MKSFYEEGNPLLSPSRRVISLDGIALPGRMVSDTGGNNSEEGTRETLILDCRSMHEEEREQWIAQIKGLNGSKTGWAVSIFMFIINPD